MVGKVRTSRPEPPGVIFRGDPAEFDAFLAEYLLVPALSAVRYTLRSGASVVLRNRTFEALPLESLPGAMDLKLGSSAELQARLIEVVALPPETLLVRFSRQQINVSVGLTGRPPHLIRSVVPQALHFVAAEMYRVIESRPAEGDSRDTSYLNLVMSHLRYAALHADGYTYSIVGAPEISGGRETGPEEAAPVVANHADLRVVVSTSGDQEQGRAIRDALIELAREYGGEADQLGPEVLGSWLQRFVLRFKAAMGSPEGREAVEKIKTRINMELVGMQQAELDNRRADSVQKLLAGLDGVAEAVIVLGQLIIVKSEGRIVVVTVDPVTAGQIENSGVLLKHPQEVLRLIAGLTTDEQSQQRSLPPGQLP